jgi:hypothetical protein
MTDSSEREKTGRTDSRKRADGAGAVEAVGTYETGDAVVFYDTENPLAWVQSRVTVRLGEME